MSGHPVGTPRQRAHAQTVRDIKRIAREQLAAHGGAALSLRAIARELGIVSSAIYRYVPSRDELLTLLIEDAYNSLGEAVETAERKPAREDLAGRWAALGHAVRGWALEHRAEYALLYGGPVPGYAAPPERTVGPGTRVAAVLVDLLAAVQRSAPEPAEQAAPPLPDELRADLRAVREGLGADVGDDLLARGLLAWSALFGTVSFELFGQFTGGIRHLDGYFEHQLARLALLLGIGPTDAHG